MKLPQHSRTGVQRIGTVSPQAAAGAAGGLESNIAQLSTAVGEIGMEVYNTKTKWDADNASANTTANMRALNRAAAENEFISPEDIPEDIEYRRYDEVSDEDGNLVETERQQIPMYEVFPQMYKTEAERQIQSQGGRIGPSSFRAAWERETKKELDAGYTKAVVNSAAQQNESIRKMQFAGIEKAMLERNYDIADSIANGYNGTDEQIRGLKEDIRRQTEMDEYNDYMSEDDLPNMIMALDTLQDDDMYDRELDSKERLTYIKALKASIGTLQAKATSTVKTQFKLLRDEGDAVVQGIKQGHAFDTTYVTDVLTRYEAAMRLDPDGMAVSAKHLGQAINWMPEIRGFMLKPEIERQEYMRDVAKAGKTSAERSEFAAVLNSANNRVNAEISKDAISFGDSMGLVELNQLDRSSPQAFAASIGGRVTSHETMLREYGKSQGYLTKDEATQFGQQLRGLPLDQRAETLGILHQSLGEKSMALWEQLRENGAGTFAVAGQVFSEGDSNTAMVILRGSDVRAESPEVLADIKQGFLPEIHSQLNGAYATNPKYQGAMVDSVLDVYAAMSNDARDMSGELDTKRLDAAVQQVTGGLETYNGWTIEPPYRGAPDDTISNWVGSKPSRWLPSGARSGLAPEYITTMGGVVGFTPQEALDDLRSGRSVLQSTGKGEYSVYIPDLGGYWKNETTGKNFKLRYDENAPKGFIE